MFSQDIEKVLFKFLMNKEFSMHSFETGLNWYVNVYQKLSILGLQYGYSIDLVAGILAVLSPGNRIERNLIETEQILKICNEGWKNTYSFSTYPANVDKAFRVARTRVVSGNVKGRKVTAFFQNCLLISDLIAVDRHILNWLKVQGIEVKSLTPRRYEKIEDAFLHVADCYNMKGYQLQAIIWQQHRENLNGSPVDPFQSHFV